MDFSGLSRAEVCEESLLREVFFVFPVHSYIALFIITVMFGYDLLTSSCIIELSSNMFIMFWFVCFAFYLLFLISFFVGENSVICISGLFMCSRLLWQPFVSKSLDFSGFSEAREVYEEVLLI